MTPSPVCNKGFAPDSIIASLMLSIMRPGALLCVATVFILATFITHKSTEIINNDQFIIENFIFSYLCKIKYFEMKRFIFSIVSLFLTAVMGYSASVSFVGNSKPVITEKPATSTGLNDLFVLYNLNGVSAQYKASSSSNVTWYRFSNLGGGYAEVVPSIKQGDVYILSKLEGDMGYIVEEGVNRYYFWVVDYSKHCFDIESVNISTEQECDVTALNPVGYGDEIKYYTINGQVKILTEGLK